MGIDLEKFTDDLESFNDKVNIFVMENKYTKKYLNEMNLDVNNVEFEEIENKFMEFKDLNQKELLDELNKFANEATQYVKENKIEFDKSYNYVCIK